MNLTREIEQFLQEKIPITRAMGVTVEDYDRERLILKAPLAANVNHLGTAFGGSLNALAVLSGYGLLWLELKDPHWHIVIRESSISYDHPVRGDLRAICVRPEMEAFELFKETLRDKGKARITLSATIDDQGVTAVRFKGTFIAMR